MGLWEGTAVTGKVSGKVGPNVFANNKGGDYIRKLSKPTNPRTLAQTLVRNTFATNSQAWRALTASQRSAWIALAASVPVHNRLGQVKYLSGSALYGRLNNNLRSVGQAVISNAPMFVGITNFTSLSLAVVAATPLLTATFAPAIPATQSVQVWASPPISAGISNAKNRMRLIGTLTNADSSPKNITTLYTAVFGSTITAGQKIFVQFVPVVNTTGQKGAPLKATAIAT